MSDYEIKCSCGKPGAIGTCPCTFEYDDGPEDCSCCDKCRISCEGAAFPSKPIQEAPAWHDRPTCPGMWICVPEQRSAFQKMEVLDLSIMDLKTGVPFGVKCAYGPIPEMEEFDE